MKIAPSILSADFAALGEAVARVESGGADQLHVDVMDGSFVPNLTIGPPVIESIRKRTRLPLDVHLMIVQPERYIETFARAGADMLTVHVEACIHLDRTLHQIREAGAKAGVALNPATAPQALQWVLDDLDLVLVLSAIVRSRSPWTAASRRIRRGLWPRRGRPRSWPDRPYSALMTRPRR